MRHKKTILLNLIFAWGICFSVALADTPPVANQPTNQATLIADINFRNPLISSQKNNIFQIYFRLENNFSKSEAGIRYGVQLVKDNKLIDEKIYTNDILSVENNNSIQKIFTYTAPGYLSGNFDLWLVAKNESGLPLATFKLKDPITLNGNGEYLEINQDSCALRIDGEAADKKYTLMQGVSLNANENLKLSCDATSHFKEPKTISITQTAFFRSAFGEQIGQPQKETSITFQPQEKKTITIAIKKPNDPQAYDTLINFYNSDQIDQAKIAQSIDAHYIIAGESATIQKFDLDKIGYQKNDSIKADLYVDANGPFNINLNLAITDQNKKNCVNEYTQQLNQAQFKTEINLKAINNCQNPIATVILKDDQNKILTKQFFIFQKDKQISVDQSKKPQSQQKPTVNSKIILILFVLFLIILSSAVIFKMRNQSNKKKSKTTKLFLLLILLGGVLVMKSNKASADTYYMKFTSSNGWAPYTFNINLDKTNYSPGESILATVDGQITIVDSNNHDSNAAYLTGTTNNCSHTFFSYGDPQLQNEVGTWTKYISKIYYNGCTAPTNSGSYSYSFDLCITGESSSQTCSNWKGNTTEDSGDIYYSVVDTPTPSCNINFGSAAYNVNDWSALTWTSTDANSGATLYCSVGGNVINNSSVSVNSSGYTGGVYGVQPTSAGTVSCVLTVKNGSKTNTCSTTAEVCASGYSWNGSACVDNTPATCSISFNSSNTTVNNWINTSWWGSANATGGTLYCATDSSHVYVNNANLGSSYSEYGIQPKAAGIVTCTLTPYNGSTAGTPCSATAEVCASGYSWNSTTNSCVATCTVSSWTPDPSTVCSGTPFTQTSNCGTTQSATGTKTDGECCIPAYTQSDCNKYNITCGSYDNGCGTNINCGTCPSGQTCNSSGQCVSTCTDTCNTSGYSACMTSQPTGAITSSAGTCCGSNEKCYECPSGTTWSTTSNSCVANCTNTCQTNGTDVHACLSSSTSLTGTSLGQLRAITDQSCCDSSKSCFGCADGYTFNGSACVANNMPSCIASFIPASLTVPGTSYLSWSSANATATYGYCTGPLPIPYGNYGSRFTVYPFSFTASQTGTETCTFTPYNGSTQGVSCSTSVNLSTYPNQPTPTPTPTPTPIPTPSCSRNCSCASTTCTGKTCNDGCGGTCSGKMTDTCPNIDCAGACGIKTAQSICGTKTCTKDCGLCNSGNWKEVVPGN